MLSPTNSSCVVRFIFFILAIHRLVLGGSTGKGDVAASTFCGPVIVSC